MNIREEDGVCHIKSHKCVCFGRHTFEFFQKSRFETNTLFQPARASQKKSFAFFSSRKCYFPNDFQKMVFGSICRRADSLASGLPTEFKTKLRLAHQHKAVSLISPIHCSTLTSKESGLSGEV